jgi:hypothetical protein
MSSRSDMLLEVSLARVQIIVTLLVSIGSTLFAVGVGFGVTIPPTLQQIVGEGVESGINLDALLVLSDFALNYSIILAGIGLMLVIVDAASGMSALGKIKKRHLSQSDKRQRVQNVRACFFYDNVPRSLFLS